MIVTMEQNLSQQDIEVLIRYAHMNPSVQRLVSFLGSYDNTVKCNTEDSEIMVDASDIFYIESVDKRTFVYTENNVLRTGQRLYQLLETLSDWGFVQVSKGCIVNLHRLSAIRQLPGSRLEATMKNGEHVLVNRNYIAGIRARLEARQQL